MLDESSSLGPSDNMVTSATAQDETLMREWLTPASNLKSSLFEDAFTEAKIRFSSVLSQDKKKSHLLNSFNTLEDVQDVVLQSKTKYESQQAHPKTQKWLQNLSHRVKLYGDILDVLVQHHPEYVSLVWGAMKFLFTTVINHEKTVTQLAKALSQIADRLPRVRLASILYPTLRMKTAVVELNAYILRFLIRSHDWYQEGVLKHIIHSITRPVELRYDDILERINECSAAVRLVAECSQQVELRVMHDQVERITTKLSSFEKRLETICTSMSVNSSAMMDTNHRLSDLQYSQIMMSLPSITLREPTNMLQYLTTTSRRLSKKQIPLMSQRFLNSLKLKDWTSSCSSRISIVKGNFQSRQALRNFCVGSIEQLRTCRVPVLFAMKTPQDDSAPDKISCIDLLKYLVRQALQLMQSHQTEKSMSLRCARFHGNFSEGEWFQVLESILGEIGGKFYIIIDLELLNQGFSSGVEKFHWLSEFLACFARLSERQSQSHIKALLVSYGPELPFILTEEEQRNFVISAKLDHSRERQRKARSRHTNRQRIPVRFVGSSEISKLPQDQV